MKKISVFDFETTGFSYTNDRVIQVGLSVDDDDPVSWIVNQNMEVSEGAVAVHGITLLKQKEFGIDPKDSFDIFYEQLNLSDIIVGYNIINFDTKFFNEDCKRFGYDLIPREKFFDMAAVMKNYFVLDRPVFPQPGQSHWDWAKDILSRRAIGKWNLGLMVRTLGIPVNKKFHDAAADVHYTRELFRKVVLNSYAMEMYFV